MMERASVGLTTVRSLGSSGSPLRQTTWVLPGVGQAGADLVVHLAFVFVGEDGHAGVALVGVGVDELLQHGEDLRRPAEDDGVSSLGDRRVALAQLLEAVLDAAREHADEGADDEDAAEGHGEHGDEEAPAPLVAAHGAGVEGAEEAHPQELDEAEGFAVLALRGDAGEPYEEGDGDDEDDREEAEAGEHGDGAARHGVVEAVAQAIREGDAMHASV